MNMKLQHLIHILIGIVCIGLFPAAQAVVPPPFEVRAGKHETRAHPQTALQLPKASENSAAIEPVSSAPPTRSSFMASWDKVADATGYLLDVATTDSFSGYVDGYHDLDVGNVTGRVVTGLDPGTTYYYRVRPYTTIGTVNWPGGYSETMTATTVATKGLEAMTTTAMGTTGLIIDATFDSSITSNPNAVAIEAMINQAISIYESLFSDPITIEILFRYATTGPDGTPLSADRIAQSDYAIYPIPWNTAVNALGADATTSNDNLAVASLPVSALSANVWVSSANGRAVGENTPPAMFADGHVGPGGPYDGIITLNSSPPFQFTRATIAGNFDAQQSTEHEIDEVMGLGSHLNISGNDLRPQDLFSWSSPGVRNFTSSGTRYFSIDGGVTNIVNFNQDPSGDFGDWLSTGCPPYVQVAFACTGQSSDVTPTSPEGINLDVIGYDLVNAVSVPTYTITTSSSPSNGGTTSGAGTFASGETVTVTATPNTGWDFVNWTENGSVVSTSANYTFTVSANRAVVANFSNLPKAATPFIQPPGGRPSHALGGAKVKLCCATPGATIYYTKDGSDPTTSSPTYNHPCPLPKGSTFKGFKVNGPAGSTIVIKAIAVAPGYSNSDIATASFTFRR
jgi:hypothetical protein